MSLWIGWCSRGAAMWNTPMASSSSGPLQGCPLRPLMLRSSMEQCHPVMADQRLWRFAIKTSTQRGRAISPAHCTRRYLVSNATCSQWCIKMQNYSEWCRNKHASNHIACHKWHSCHIDPRAACGAYRTMKRESLFKKVRFPTTMTLYDPMTLWLSMIYCHWWLSSISAWHHNFSANSGHPRPLNCTVPSLQIKWLISMLMHQLWLLVPPWTGLCAIFQLTLNSPIWLIKPLPHHHKNMPGHEVVQ